MSSLCNVCLKVVDARVFEEDGAAWLEKTCPEHGQSRVMIERSWEAYLSYSLFRNEITANQFATTIIPVTDRCNIRCPHCYHVPGNQSDPSIDEILRLCELSSLLDITLMGAEPTVRDDLPAIVKAISQTGRRVRVYSNAIRLADKQFTEKLRDAGLTAFCLSIHNQTYLDKSNLFTKKMEALDVIRDVGVKIDHMSFTLKHPDDVGSVLDLMNSLRGRADHYRIRIPARIGTCDTDPFFMSDFDPILCAEIEKRGWGFSPVRFDNNPYHLMVLIDGMLTRIIRWPSIEEVDLDILQHPPYALFVEELGEVNFVHSALVHARRRAP